MRQWDANIIIAGGGMVGLSLGIGLARAGVSVMLLERTPMAAQLDAAFDGRVSAIARGSSRLLARLGVWENLLPYAQPIWDIRVSDGHSPLFLHYDHREVDSEPFGWIVENRHIRWALAQAAEALPNLAVAAPEELTHLTADEGGVTVQCKNRGALRAQLLAAADGKQSRARELADIPVLETDYGQTAIVCTIAHEKPHGGLAQERFLPAGPFAVLPMTGNRSSLVWTEARRDAPVFLQLPNQECAHEIRERVGDYLGAITLEGPRFSYPLSAMHARRYIAPRLCLVGDAAHAIHPIAGQGVNLGFRDVAVLVELIAERFALGLDIGSQEVLSHYQRWRRFDNLTMLTVTDGLNRLFSNQLAPVQLARGAGLWAVSHMPALKRFFMRHAMGLTGDVPKLMREG
ncbi:MAG: UbiH/UbiF/VisC/COQ6 family ubiquinone biosynthesis hydroxylase [Alphaproteobacteria bacterium]|nr:UbiH/UbiF/VisC/COQ6 family ubiquinone biosynthesis hydroxylase [Alphaproteobacteria bacterium]